MTPSRPPHDPLTLVCSCGRRRGAPSSAPLTAAWYLLSASAYCLGLNKPHSHTSAHSFPSTASNSSFTMSRASAESLKCALTSSKALTSVPNERYTVALRTKPRTPTHRPS
eukprot:960369-Prorocentrum_minimum.AAC.1